MPPTAEDNGRKARDYPTSCRRNSPSGKAGTPVERETESERRTGSGGPAEDRAGEERRRSQDYGAAGARRTGKEDVRPSTTGSRSGGGDFSAGGFLHHPFRSLHSV